MDTLRWILLVVGILVIAGLFGYYKWQERRAVRPRRRTSRAARSRSRGDRDVEAALQDMDDFVLGDETDDTAGMDRDLAAMEMDPADEAVGPSRPAGNAGVSHHESVDDQDWTVGPVRVRHVGEPETDRPRPAASEPATPELEEAGWADDSDADAPGVADDEFIRSEADERPGRRAGGDDEAWNLGPVRIPRPSWRRDADRSGGDDADQDEAKAQDAVTEAVGEKIVVLHVHAGEGLCFTAPAVQEALEATGLRFGQHGIFHRHVETRRGHEPMFSVASMVKPGTLDPDQPDTLETPGLALFMQLPGPSDGLSAFEQMLEAARRLADQLEGHLLDGTRCDLTNQAVEHIREELREYRRLAHLAARRHHA